LPPGASALADADVFADAYVFAGADVFADADALADADVFADVYVLADADVFADVFADSGVLPDTDKVVLLIASVSIIGKKFFILIIFGEK